MSRLDDPALVAAEYADEGRLRRRARGFAVVSAREVGEQPVDEGAGEAVAHVVEEGLGKDGTPLSFSRTAWP